MIWMDQWCTWGNAVRRTACNFPQPSRLGWFKVNGWVVLEGSERPEQWSSRDGLCGGVRKANAVCRTGLHAIF